MLVPWRTRMIYKYRLWRRPSESIEKALDRLTNHQNRRLSDFTEEADR